MHLSDAQAGLAEQLNTVTEDVLLLQRKIAERQARGDDVRGFQQALAAQRRKMDGVQEQLRAIV
ncbi:MAG: hypothetical protein HYT31_01275 [Parcubacteria group bacterium]|nr:hypothetical protein [Parcubacteria group bacterium]